MPSPVRRTSYGSVTVFWLDSEEAIRRLSDAGDRLLDEDPMVGGVYLFGSLARGRAVPGSDADVLVLLDGSERRFVDRPLDFLPFFEDVGLSVDLFCYTKDEMRNNSFAIKAFEEARTLAERRGSDAQAERS